MPLQEINLGTHAPRPSNPENETFEAKRTSSLLHLVCGPVDNIVGPVHVEVRQVPDCLAVGGGRSCTLECRIGTRVVECADLGGGGGRVVVKYF
jgi:hypothetical protein